jgi:glycosyltransferase involved in cell wall biosynthesis
MAKRLTSDSSFPAPTYSIVIPTYERTTGFIEALESALAVKGCSEVLVVDDASSHHDFRHICSEYSDPRLKYQRNDQRAGLFANWNRGIAHASSEFVSVLCSDDLVSSRTYSLLCSALSRDPELDIMFGSFCTFTTHPTSDLMTHREFAAGPVCSELFLRDLIANGPGFPVLNVTRREVLLANPFVAQPHSGNDWLWIYSNAARLSMYAVDEPISFWRRHSNQDAVRSRDVTTDCWPAMYLAAADELSDRRVAARAKRRAKGVVLTWLLNEWGSPNNHYARLREPNCDDTFMIQARNLALTDPLLKKLLESSGPSATIARNAGRVVRRLGIYPAT